MTEYLLRVRAESSAARILVRAAMQIIGEYADDPQVLHDFDLILTEACSNVFIHAYKGKPCGDVEILIVPYPGESVRIEVSDWGPGFDLDVCKMDFPPPTSESGRGLGIMSRLTSGLRQDRSEGKHTIMFTKRLDGAA